jgi:hypothetical protein
MKRTNLKRALLASAALLLVTTSAYGQSEKANPHAKANAADPAHKAGAPAANPATPAANPAAPAPGAKADEAKKNLDDKDKKDKAGEAKGMGHEVGDRASRKAKQLEDQKAKLRASLKGPMDEAAKQELRRHAERVARLERIKSLAETAKDTDVAERATKLLAKENARHDKWMEKLAANPGGGTPAAAPGAPGAPGAPAAPAAPDSKGGAK